jgi:hypothetical protein
VVNHLRDRNDLRLSFITLVRESSPISLNYNAIHPDRHVTDAMLITGGEAPITRILISSSTGAVILRCSPAEVQVTI